MYILDQRARCPASDIHCSWPCYCLKGSWSLIPREASSVGKPAPGESWAAAAAWQSLFLFIKSFWANHLAASLKGKY